MYTAAHRCIRVVQLGINNVCMHKGYTETCPEGKVGRRRRCRAKVRSPRARYGPDEMLNGIQRVATAKKNYYLLDLVYDRQSYNTRIPTTYLRTKNAFFFFSLSLRRYVQTST